VDLSDNGMRLAISTIKGTSPLEGNIRMFEYNGSSWTQLGITIVGNPNPNPDTNQFGSRICISADGSRVAASSPSNGGYVKVYEYNGSSWQQLGSDISGPAGTSGVYTGSDISDIGLSPDGNRLVVGSSRFGYVRVYEFTSGSWVLLGSEISGQAADSFGSSTAISSDGSIVAIGGKLNSGNGVNSGHVQVYEWDGSLWNQLGGDIFGEGSDHQLGDTVLELSADGMRIAVSSTRENYVQVLAYDGSSWNRLGQIIDGASNSHFGRGLSITPDGSRLGVGARRDKVNGQNAGLVQIYDFDGSSWVQVGPNIYGNIQDQAGVGVAVSADGSIVAFGSDRNSPGHVSVVEDSCR